VVDLKIMYHTSYKITGKKCTVELSYVMKGIFCVVINEFCSNLEYHVISYSEELGAIYEVSHKPV